MQHAELYWTVIQTKMQAWIICLMVEIWFISFFFYVLQSGRASSEGRQCVEAEVRGVSLLRCRHADVFRTGCAFGS